MMHNSKNIKHSVNNSFRPKKLILSRTILVMSLIFLGDSIHWSTQQHEDDAKGVSAEGVSWQGDQPEKVDMSTFKMRKVDMSTFWFTERKWRLFLRRNPKSGHVHISQQTRKWTCPHSSRPRPLLWTTPSASSWQQNCFLCGPGWPLALRDTSGTGWRTHLLTTWT